MQSDWVCEEAAEGRQLGRLVPALIERVRPPAANEVSAEAEQTGCKARVSSEADGYYVAIRC